MNVLPQIDVQPKVGNDLWYKDAIIYQLHVKAFADSNGDGIGDFAGLTEKLDYLQDLGVTTLWLLPFYPSPGKDDGYDIADYRRINPDFGTMRDFRRFMTEAKRRDLRVITELVINHTSDQHPWFKRARRSGPGSDARNWYVWSDTDKKYAGTRIIFTDTEKSNWTWDQEAKAYYWHRFFSHQPDLNFDNPRVLWAMIQVMRRWLDMGVDGFRLDAIPYLCEREGTNNENLPETHAIIKKIRRELDAYSPGKVLLAEANQWPEDVSAYFGDGDECHMAYHFPLMPRIYMAIAQEDRFPIADILRQTPEIPAELPVGAVSAQSRRADPGNGHRRRARLSVVDLRQRSARADQPRHPAAARVADGQRPPQDRVDELAAVLVSRHADHLLRRRDRHGRQHLSRRPQRRAHADAVDLGPQRRLFALRSGAALPAGDHGSGLRPPVRQRRGPAAQPLLVPELDEAADRRAAIQQRVQPRHLELHPSGEPHRAGLRPAIRERHHPVRRQPVALGAGRRNRSQPLEGPRADWRCSGKRRFPASATSPTSSRCAPYGFFWFLLGDQPEPKADPRAVPREFTTLVWTDGSNSLIRNRERHALEHDVLPHFLLERRWFADKARGLPTPKLQSIIPLERDGISAAFALDRRSGARNGEQQPCRAICFP